MKRFISIILTLSVIIGAMPCISAETQDIPDDFVAGWDFETCTDDGKIYDLNSGKYNGVIKGNVSRDTEAKYAGDYGLSCTGANGDYMAAPGLGNYFSDKSEISISGWYKTSSMDKERSLFSVQNSLNSSGMSMNILTSGKVKLQFRNTNTTGGGLVSVTSSDAVTINTWTHIVATVALPQSADGTAQMQIYINGVLSGSASADANGMTVFEHFAGATEASDFKVGGLGSSSLIGSLDNFRVYERILTQSEAESLAAEGKETGIAYPEEKLVLSYDFEEAEGSTTVSDISGNGYDGILSNDGVSISDGYVDSGLLASGTSNAFVYNDSTVSEFNNAKAVSVMGWFKQEMPVSDSNYMLFNLTTDKTDGTETQSVNMISIYINSADNTLKIGARSNTDDSMYTLNTGYVIPSDYEWHHYAFIIDYENTGKDGAYICFWLDGEQTKWTNVANLNQRYLSVNDSVTVRFAGTGNQPFNGYVDNIRLYNKRISNSVITAEASIQGSEYESPEPVAGSESYVAAWDCNSFTDGKVTELTNTWDGVINDFNSMMLIPRKGLDGTRGLENKNVASSAMYAPGLGHFLKEKSAVTVAFWLNLSELPEEKDAIMFNIPNNAGNVGFMGKLTTSGVLRTELRTKGNAGIKSTSSSALNISTGDWHHYIFTADLSGGYRNAVLKIYFDGEPVAVLENVDAGKMITFESLGRQSDGEEYLYDDFRFGANGSYVTAGTFDNIYVYDRAMTDEEIAEEISPLSENPQLSSLKIGGTECIDAEGISVESTDEYGAISEIALPAYGIEYTLTEDADTEITQNGVQVDNIKDILINNGDTFVIKVRDSLNREKIYKITVGKISRICTAIKAENESGNTADSIEQGKIRFSAGVKSLSDNQNCRLIAALYGDSGPEKISVCSFDTEVGGEQTLSAEIDVPEGEGYYAKAFLWQDDMLPAADEKLLLSEEQPKLIDLDIENAELNGDFAQMYNNLSASVDNSVSEIYVTPYANDNFDVYVNGELNNNGTKSDAIKLNVGYNAVYIAVRNDDGTEQSNYVLHVKRRQLPELMYKDTYRPQFHYTSDENWLSDPNVLVYNEYTEEYHLFYQYNPFGYQWNYMSMGHAVSKDLVHWTEKDANMFPDELGAIYDGCGIIDVNNTTGLFTDEDAPQNRMVMIFTHDGETEYGKQKQSLAYSKDGGETWIKYHGNPVIPNPDGLYSTAFRDPKVIWIDDESNINGGEWLMVVAGASPGCARLFTSDNLIDWTYNSDMLTADGSYIRSDCPSLEKMYVNGDESNPKWVYNGAGRYYVVGDLVKNSDGLYEFNAETNRLTLFNGDEATYATQTYFNDPKGRIISMSWMQDPIAEGYFADKKWKGAMTVPFEHELKYENGRYRLTSYPAEELWSLRGETVFEASDISVNEETPDILEGVYAETMNIEAEITIDDAEEFGFCLRASEDFSQQTVIKYTVEDNMLTLDKTNSGVTHNTVKSFDMQPLSGNKIKLSILVDVSTVDVFGNDGLSAISSFNFPDSSSTAMSFYTVGGSVKIDDIKIFAMESALPSSE